MDKIVEGEEDDDEVMDDEDEGVEGNAENVGQEGEKKD